MASVGAQRRRVLVCAAIMNANPPSDFFGLAFPEPTPVYRTGFVFMCSYIRHARDVSRKNPARPTTTRICRTQSPVLAAIPLRTDIFHRNIVRKLFHFGHTILAFTLHYALVSPVAELHAVRILHHNRRHFGKQPKLPQKKSIFVPFLADQISKSMVSDSPSLRSGEGVRGRG